MQQDAHDDNLSMFGPDSEMRKWFVNDLSTVSPAIRWRILFQHGQPSEFDGWSSASDDPDRWCGTTAYRGYCDLLNLYNVDFVFTGHWGQGLRRHVSLGAGAEDIIYSYRNIQGGHGFSSVSNGERHGITHVRLRDDAIVLSRLWYGNVRDMQGNPITAMQQINDNLPDPPFLTDQEGQPGIGTLYECYKYVPGVKSGCDASRCVRQAYTLTRWIRNDCSMPNYDLAALDDLGWGLRVPCCNQPHPSDPNKCLDGNGQEVSRQVTLNVLACDRSAIAAGCLRRQIIPIVINAAEGDSIPYVTNEQLLQECTPCVRRPDGHITGLSDKCGAPVEPGAIGRPQ